MAEHDIRARGGLKRFSEMSGFSVASDDPDIRGWDVVGADGQIIGEVDDLFVDTERMKVREVDVDIKGGEHVTLPIERVQVDHASRQVRIEGYPGRPGVAGEYARGAGVAGTERGSYGAGRTAGEEGRLTRSEEELRVGKQRTSAGEAVIGKHVETERVSEPVSLEREEVEVKRRPVEPGRSAEGVGIGDDEIRVPLTEEEAVVEKRPVVKEELVIGKHTVEDTKNVETDVRREEFDVDESSKRPSGRRRE